MSLLWFKKTLTMWLGVFLRHRYIHGLNVLLNFRRQFAKVGETGLCVQGRSHTAVMTKHQFSVGIAKKQWHCIESQKRRVFQLPYPDRISAVFLIQHLTSQEFSDRLKMLLRIKHLFILVAVHPHSWASAVVQLQVSDGKPLAFYCAVWKIPFV